MTIAYKFDIDNYTLQIGDIIIFTDHEVYEVRQDFNFDKYFLFNLAILEPCNSIFKVLKMDNVHDHGYDYYDFQKQILGYKNPENVFPVCKSLEHLTKFVKAIFEKIESNGNQ